MHDHVTAINESVCSNIMDFMLQCTMASVSATAAAAAAAAAVNTAML